MTRKLFNIILTTCFIFGSLYLPAHAEEASKTTFQASDSQLEKHPETLYLEGNACLNKGDLVCSSVALAKIPSRSSYAKLLQGSIALTQHDIDTALQLLLPLQAENNLTSTAKANLHQSLANAFESIHDPQQALRHLIQAESALTSQESPDAHGRISVNHEKIWLLISKLDHDQLVAMRGNNTDYIFQGWIDLSLAHKNQDTASSFNIWTINYADHPALDFAQNRYSSSVKLTTSSFKLPTEEGIAIILSTPDAKYSDLANAFKLGLQTALQKSNIKNPITLYPERQDQTDLTEQLENNHPFIIEEAYQAAKDTGNTYFIMLELNNDGTMPPPSPNAQEATWPELKIGLNIQDEALALTSFAIQHAIERIVIITTDDTLSQQKAASFRKVWLTERNLNDDTDTLRVITLPSGITIDDTRLLDIKSLVMATPHDMVLLAIAKADAYIIKPYLDIGTPTLAFSDIHEMVTNNTLNAIRFPEIPFLLDADNSAFKDYHAGAASLESNILLRWFSLGADALPLLVEKLKISDEQVVVNGLTGKLMLHKNMVQRQLPIARFTYDSIILE